MTNFDAALLYLVSNESGVYTNNPADPGGPTKWGVTLNAWARFTDFKQTKPEDIEALTFDDVKPFYQKIFWEPLACESIHDPAIAIAIFDTGVLYGVTFAGLFTQQALGICGAIIVIDGIIGARTIDALNHVPRSQFIDSYCKFVLRRIESIIRKNPKDEVFRKGWTARADKLLTLV